MTGRVAMNSLRPSDEEGPLMAADRYDVIVVGGGHNGLVAAAYLAKI